MPLGTRAGPRLPQQGGEHPSKTSPAGILRDLTLTAAATPRRRPQCSPSSLAPPLAPAYSNSPTVFVRALAEILFKQLPLFERFPNPAGARGTGLPYMLCSRACRIEQKNICFSAQSGSLGEARENRVGRAQAARPRVPAGGGQCYALLGPSGNPKTRQKMRRIAITNTAPSRKPLKKMLRIAIKNSPAKNRHKRLRFNALKNTLRPRPQNSCPNRHSSDEPPPPPDHKTDRYPPPPPLTAPRLPAAPQPPPKGRL